MQLYGVRGWGSGITEAMLSFAGLKYDFIDVEGFDKPGPARDRLQEINPLCQVPTLILPDGSVMTETAAIALYLADMHPSLAPPIDTPERATFYRLLIWLVTNVYPTFTYGDYPERWVTAGADELVSATDQYRQSLYLWLEEQMRAPFVLGEAVSALDIYVAALVNWRPRQDLFRTNTPKIMGGRDPNLRYSASSGHHADQRMVPRRVLSYDIDLR